MKRFLIAGAALFAAAAVTGVVLKGGVTPSSATAAPPGGGLSAYVVFSNRGPIPPCDPNSCSDAANFTWIYAHIVNNNPLVNSTTAGSPRSGATNAFVLDSVDETILVNGSVFSQGHIIPAPNTADRFGTAGRWPTTVTCGNPITLPCNTVLNPAILSGEDTIGFYDGWFHSTAEPAGGYVWRFTFHGTVNGAPVDLTASSRPIQMT